MLSVLISLLFASKDRAAIASGFTFTKSTVMVTLQEVQSYNVTFGYW